MFQVKQNLSQWANQKLLNAHAQVTDQATTRETESRLEWAGQDIQLRLHDNPSQMGKRKLLPVDKYSPYVDMYNSQRGVTNLVMWGSSCSRSLGKGASVRLPTWSSAYHIQQWTAASDWITWASGSFSCLDAYNPFLFRGFNDGQLQVREFLYLNTCYGFPTSLKCAKCTEDAKPTWSMDWQKPSGCIKIQEGREYLDYWYMGVRLYTGLKLSLAYVGRSFACSSC
jgi:hypothetical protein